MANHESFVDMLLISHIPWEMKWLSKESIFKIPLLGWMMRMSNDILLRRGDKRSIIAAMRDANDRLDHRLSVMIFPEGTRTRDGSLGEFKDGAFRLAIEKGCPILPLVVDGTRTALEAIAPEGQGLQLAFLVLPAQPLHGPGITATNQWRKHEKMIRNCSFSGRQQPAAPQRTAAQDPVRAGLRESPQRRPLRPRESS